MSTVTKVYTFTNGTKADATEVNKDFDDIYAGVNALSADVLQRGYNVRSAPYNASGGGVTDDFTAMQSAITAAANSILVIPYGTYMLSDQLVISNPMTIWCFGTLKPSTTGVANTPLIKITSSNVHILGFGLGMIDGNSKLWCGILAENSAVVIENITVDGMRFQNIAVDSNLAYVIDFSSVKNGSVTNNTLKNSGVISNVIGGGFGIYLEFCQGCIVTNNQLDTVGSSGINSSCGVNNIIQSNKINKVTLFGIKTGCGGSTSITSDVSSTTTVFSIAKSSSTTKQWFIGSSFFVIQGDATKIIGIVKKIEDFTTYYKITSTLMSGVPTSGKEVQLYDMGTKSVDNQIIYTGDNAFDMNTVHSPIISRNKILYGGLYRDAGTFAGLNAGIWVGADDQGSVICLTSENVKIENNEIYQIGGSAIGVFNTNNLSVGLNECYNFNINNSADSYGIEVGRLGSNRLINISVNGNKVVANNGNGYSMYVGYFTNGLITGNQIDGKKGMQINTPVGAVIEANQIITSDTSVYGLLISDVSGTNPGSGVNIIGNEIRCNGASSTGIVITDTGVALGYISNSNVITAETKVTDSSTAKFVYTKYSVGVGSKIVAAIFESASGAYTNTVAAGSTITIAQFNADNGTAGKVVVEGIARDGTTNAEDFTVRASGGYLATDTVSFTSNAAPRGSAFLASGDFTLVANGTGGLMDFKYTNNEAGPVSLNLHVTVISRF